MLCSNLGEHFAVEVDACLSLRIDEGAVALEAHLAECGVQANDPELTVVSLLVAAVVKGVLTSVDQRLLCKALLS